MARLCYTSFSLYNLSSMANNSERPLRVLLWSPNGAGLHYGGPGMTAYRLYSKAAPGRFELTLAHGNPDQADYPLFAHQHLIAPLGNLSIAKQWNFIRRGRRWIDEHAHEFDVFHGLQGFHLTVDPAFHAQKRGLPAVVKLAAFRSDLADKKGWKALLGLPARRRQLLSQICGVIAISQNIVDELRSYGFPEEKIFPIPNGVRMDQFFPTELSGRARQRLELGWPDIPTFLFVGEIVPRKNPLKMVEAVGLLKQKGVVCQIVLAGPERDQQYIQTIRSRAQELGLGSSIIWTGFTRNVAPLYRAADVFGLPSDSEGMPNALLEAMASGLPAIATPISGITDLIQDGVNGRLTAAQPEQIAEALLLYINNLDLAVSHGQAARGTILERFSARAVLDAHEQLFRKMLSSKSVAK
jgi:glycosyltransferase involved in cell wall biosynthesis